MDRSHLAGFPAGRVSGEHRDAYLLLTAEGERVAKVAGRFRHAARTRSDLPVVGDWVAFSENPGGAPTIHAVLPRTSLLMRAAAGNETVEQPIAANVDVLFLVAGLDEDFNLRRLERYLAFALESGVTPVIVLNKSDTCADLLAHLTPIEDAGWNVPVHVISAARTDGIDALAEYARGEKTLALVGSSGVGKSSIVNALLGEARQATNEVRESDSRGRHTTTSRALFALPNGGAVLDTPGMRTLALWDADAGIRSAFGDIEELARACRFSDCTHGGEPGCAIAEALGVTLDPGRYESYCKLMREEAHRRRRVDVRERAAASERWKRIHRDAREHVKFKRRQ